MKIKNLLKSLAFIGPFVFGASASAADLEYTYGEDGVVIATEKVDNDHCEVASCSAYAYYSTLKSLDAAIERTCRERKFKKYVIVKTERNTERAQGLVLTMTGLCKGK